LNKIQHEQSSVTNPDLQDIPSVEAGATYALLMMRPVFWMVAIVTDMGTRQDQSFNVGLHISMAFLVNGRGELSQVL